MKVSELIAHLALLIAEEGDMEIQLPPADELRSMLADLYDSEEFPCSMPSRKTVM